MALTAFYKHEIVARGAADEIASALRKLPPPDRASDLLVFDDETGKQVDVDLRPAPDGPLRGRGRPSLGVEAKEVTLLPRHWEWLSSQRGGASATLRRLVEDASRKGRSVRDNQDSAYRFLSAMAGDFPRFEDTVRELYLGNKVGYDHFTYEWPAAIRDHARRLAWPE